MDRFIEFPSTVNRSKLIYLKSNMDRFIDFVFDELGNNFSHLKSNMDRFIVAIIYCECI